MKRYASIDHLHRQGCQLKREDARHSVYENPATGAKAPVPRHSEIDNRLALKVCRELEVQPIR